MSICMFAIHFVSFKRGSAKLGRMAEYQLEQVEIGYRVVYVWYRVSSRDCHS